MYTNISQMDFEVLRFGHALQHPRHGGQCSHGGRGPDRGESRHFLEQICLEDILALDDLRFTYFVNFSVTRAVKDIVLSRIVSWDISSVDGKMK